MIHYVGCSGAVVQFAAWHRTFPAILLPPVLSRNRPRLDAADRFAFRPDMVAIALYQPDIPQNCGAILRLAACLDTTTHVVGPAGFDLSDRALRRAGMDYLDHAALVRHTSWAAFEAWRGETPGRRLVLATTGATLAYTGFAFADNDLLLFGRESAGVPDEVHQAAQARIKVPMVGGLRSLNVATSVAMILGEALRQTGGFPCAARQAEVL